MVFAAPRMRENRMFTPSSPGPQNELQKSLDVLPLYGSMPGTLGAAYWDNDVTEVCAIVVE